MQNREFDGSLEPARHTPSELKADKLALFGLAILVAYSAIRSMLRAASKPFWIDEVYTWGMTRQPNFSALWNALGHASDSNPPGYYVIEKAFSGLIPHQEIALRLPSIIAFCCLLICIFVFVKKRSGSEVGLVCAAMTLITVFYDTYAVEARPYLLVAACVAFAMICYQRAPALPWMLLMGVSLAVSQSVHYYTVFILVPFGIAEAALFCKTRRIRWAVWLALILGFIPFILFWPLLSASGKYYGSHFWAHPSFFGAESIYGWFLNIPYALGVGIAAACTSAVLITLVARWDGDEKRIDIECTPFQEYVLVLSLIGLPFIVFFATRIAGNGAIVQRYVLAAGLAIQIAFSYILKRLGRPAVMLFAIFLIFAVASNDTQFWLSQLHHPGRMVSPAAPLETMLDSGSLGDLPVVISDGTDYLPIVHYASPKWASHYVSLVDVPASLAYTGSDSVDKALLLWRSYLPLQVYEYPAFALEHPTFLLYSSNGGQFDWWPARLLKEGNSLRLVALEQNRRLYLVNLKSKDQH